jgi:alpha-1,6-mannosyltransferase
MQKTHKFPPDSVTKGLLLLLGLASILPYLYAWSLQDLRKNTIQFLVAFCVAFLLYAAATLLALKYAWLADRWTLIVVFGGAILFCGLLIFTPPTLSDDMYRYVWDGRVQAEGVSPYRYPPNAPELARLRDSQIWRFINRKSAVTVYPPGAEAMFAILWRIVPDSVRWFQLVMSGSAILAGLLLVGLLREMGRSPLRALIFLWSPLLIFESAHAAHVDALILSLLVGAWWGRVREKDGLVGALIGLATAIKFYPALILPALWRPRHPRGRWTMPLAFISVMVVLYLPYIWLDGGGVLGFLPSYLNEVFNISPLVEWLIYRLPHDRLAQSQAYVRMLSLGLWGLASLLMILFPAQDSASALRRCLWPISIITLLNQNLFSWYMLWLLPLLAIFLQEGALRWGKREIKLGLRLDAWTAWWLFSGLAALSYTFFIDWKPEPAAIRIQFWPLYILLALSLATGLLRKARIPFHRAPGLVRSSHVSGGLEG